MRPGRLHPVLQFDRRGASSCPTGYPALTSTTLELWRLHRQPDAVRGEPERLPDGTVCSQNHCVAPCGTGGTCPAGEQCVQGGCVPTEQPLFTCPTDGVQDACASGSICLHHSCYIACDPDAGALGLPERRPVQRVQAGDGLGRHLLRVRLEHEPRHRVQPDGWAAVLERGGGLHRRVLLLRREDSLQRRPRLERLGASSGTVAQLGRAHEVYRRATEALVGAIGALGAIALCRGPFARDAVAACDTRRGVAGAARGRRRAVVLWRGRRGVLRHDGCVSVGLRPRPWGSRRRESSRRRSCRSH